VNRNRSVRPHLIAGVMLAIMCTAALAARQELLPNSSLAMIADPTNNVLEGDAIPDIIISPNNGNIVSRVFDGATFADLGSGVPFGGFGGGVRMAAGDLTGDGVADIVAAMGPGGGLVKLLNGVNAADIGSGFPFGGGFGGGVNVALADFNGDGRLDIVTAQATGGGTVSVFNGVDYAPLFTIQPFGAGFAAGVNVATGDTNGDGVPDLVVGQARGGLVSIVNGATRTVTLSGVPFGGGGVYVAAGDVNGDGRADVIAAPDSGAGPVLVYDVNALAPITTFMPYGAGYPGGVRVAATDFNGDGRVEILTVPGPAGQPIMKVFDGATFTNTQTLQVYPSSFTNGVFVAVPTATGLRFVSAAATTFTVGTAGSFSVQVVGSPAANIITLTGALPAGVTLTNNGSGTASLSGTPAAGSGGTYPITISASSGAGAPTVQAFTLTVNEAPAITSAAAAAFTQGVASSFTVTSSGFPAAALTFTGALPSGVTFTDNGNGTATIAGTAAAATSDTYPLSVTANNSVGIQAQQSFTLTVNQAPAITSGNAATFVTNQLGSFAITTTGVPTPTVSVTGTLPAGVTFTADGTGGGTIAGTPTTAAGSPFTVTIGADNGVGVPVQQTFTLTVNAAAVATDDTFSNGVGNTQYSVGAGTPATPAVVVAGNVLSNDTGTAALSAGPVSIASTNGGQVTMSTDGTFLYTPGIGFAGPSDTFTYTMTDGSGATDAAVVTINMSGVVWYVNAAGGAGDGRSQSPFNTMTAAATAAQANQIIYVHQGSPAGATALKASQTLWGAGATFTLNGLTILATSAPTLQGTVTLANNVALNSLVVNGSGDVAIAGNGLSGTETLTGVSITGGTSGLSLVAPSGTFTMVGGEVTGVSGDDVVITGGSGALTIGASITNTSGRSVNIQNRTAGTVTFSGAISDTGAGILLNANSGAIVAFTGGLTLTTGDNDAFTAVAGGTVVVTQASSTIVNTLSVLNGTALRVENTRIGSAGLTFRSINSGAPPGDSTFTSGAGIVLLNTGVAAEDGSLTVTGVDLVADSGGAIRRKVGVFDSANREGIGIYLENTKSPSFNRMRLENFENSGMIVREVAGLLLESSLVSNAGDAAGEAPIVFGLPNPGGVNGLITGTTATIRNTKVELGFEHNLAFYGHSGTTTLRVDRTTPTAGDCQVSTNQPDTGVYGLLAHFEGTAVGTVIVDQCRLRSDRVAALMARALDTATLDVTVSGSEISRGIDGLVLTNSDDADLVSTITDNTITAFTGAGVFVGQSPLNASALSELRVTITGNMIDSPAGGTATNVLGRLSSTIGQISQTRLLIANNGIPTQRGLAQSGLTPAVQIETPDDGSTPNVSVTIIDNHVDMYENPEGSGIQGPWGIDVNATRGDLCAHVANNISHGYRPYTSAGGIQVRQSAPASFTLAPGVEAPGSAALTVLQNNNPFPDMSYSAIGTITTSGTCLVP